MENQTGAEKKFYKKWWFWGVVVLIVLFGVGAFNGNSTQSDSVMVQTCSGFSSSTAQTIDYKELNKDPDSFKSQNATFTGQVVQIQESDGNGFMRISVDKDEFGWNANDIVLVDYQGHTDVVEGDIVNVGGVMQGSETYTSQANFQITVPLMYACSFAKATVTNVSTSQANTEPQTLSGQTAAQVVSASTSSQSKPKATWHVVGQYSGETQKNTEPFTIQGSQWRVTWKETGEGFFGAEGVSPDGSGSYCAVANLVGAGSDTTYCYSSGTYYLSANTTNSWSMVVEDYY